MFRGSCWPAGRAAALGVRDRGRQEGGRGETGASTRAGSVAGAPPRTESGNPDPRDAGCRGDTHKGPSPRALGPEDPAPHRSDGRIQEGAGHEALGAIPDEGRPPLPGGLPPAAPRAMAVGRGGTPQRHKRRQAPRGRRRSVAGGTIVRAARQSRAENARGSRPWSTTPWPDDQGVPLSRRVREGRCRVRRYRSSSTRRWPSGGPLLAGRPGSLWQTYPQ